MNMKKSKRKYVVVDNSLLPEVVNHQSKKSDQMTRFIDKMNKISSTKKTQSGKKLSVIIDLVPDKDDPSIVYPIRKDMTLPSSFFMQFDNTRFILHHPSNKLTMIDFYLFNYLCDHYAEFKQFFIGKPFWDDIEADMQSLELNYTQKSLQNSLAKLHKATLILKMAKSCYSINKILIFKGSLETMPNQIKDQYQNIK